MIKPRLKNIHCHDDMHQEKGDEMSQVKFEISLHTEGHSFKTPEYKCVILWDLAYDSYSRRLSSDRIMGYPRETSFLSSKDLHFNVTSLTTPSLFEAVSTFKEMKDFEF